MRIAVRVTLFAIGIALAYWLYSVFFPSPEKIIRRHLASLANSASFSSNESMISRAARVLKLRDFFDEKVEINYEYPRGNPQTLSGLQELIVTAEAVPLGVGSLRVELLDPNVALSEDKQSAVVDLTLRARVPGEKEFFVQEMKFLLKKTKDGWRIFKIETVKTLSKHLHSPRLHLRIA